MAVAAGAFGLAAIGGASADQPDNLTARGARAGDNASCIGSLSSAFTQNGQGETLGKGDSAHGVRGAEVQFWLAAESCPVILPG